MASIRPEPMSMEEWKTLPDATQYLLFAVAYEGQTRLMEFEWEIAYAFYLTRQGDYSTVDLIEHYEKSKRKIEG